MPRPRPFINRLVQELSWFSASAFPRPKAQTVEWLRHREEVLEACRAELGRSTQKEALIRRLPFELATVYGDTPHEFDQVFREVEAALREAYEVTHSGRLEDVWSGTNSSRR